MVNHLGIQSNPHTACSLGDVFFAPLGLDGQGREPGQGETGGEGAADRATNFAPTNPKSQASLNRK